MEKTFKYYLPSQNIGNDSNTMILNKPQKNTIEFLKRFNCQNSWLKRKNFKTNTLDSNILDSNDNMCGVDLNFYNNVNNLTLDSKKNLEHSLVNNYVYHPNQICNITKKNLDFYTKNDEYYVKINSNFILLKDYLHDNVYNKSFDDLINDIILKEDKIVTKNIDLILLVFIGSIEVGRELINKIQNYKKKQSFSLAICFKNIAIYNVLKSIIINNFDNYNLYISNEYGADIIPTLMMYNNLIHKHKIKNIIKLHTKSDRIWFNKLTNYLLSYTHLELQQKLNKKQSNCVGRPEYNVVVKKDLFNNGLKQQYKNYIDQEKTFSMGTMFYCEDETFNKCLEFIKNNNYLSYFINNIYHNNSFFRNSPVHFLERLFGCIN